MKNTSQNGNDKGNVPPSVNVDYFALEVLKDVTDPRTRTEWRRAPAGKEGQPEIRLNSEECGLPLAALFTLKTMIGFLPILLQDYFWR